MICPDYDGVKCVKKHSHTIHEGVVTRTKEVINKETGLKVKEEYKDTITWRYCNACRNTAKEDIATIVAQTESRVRFSLLEEFKGLLNAFKRSDKLP